MSDTVIAEQNTNDIAAEESKREVFDTGQTFADLGLSEDLLRGITEAGFEHPTHVQARLIPLAIEGHDVLGQSRTGSGKTAAFGLPLLQRARADKPFSALVLVPTRELAVQVTHELRQLGRFTKHRTMAVYGGQRIRVQTEKLKKNPHIIVGTPGRVMDLHARDLLPYDKLAFVVLDEVDRMLDIGFRDDIRRILGAIKQKHQTIFVSATISPEIERLANRHQHEPKRLELSDKGSLTVQQVSQTYYAVEPWDKRRLMLHLIKQQKPELVLIFCRTKQTVDALAEWLKRKDVDASAIHGDMYQNRRNRVMQKLRDGQLHVLVASDLAARGLDVDGISHVVNYDVPEDPEVYVHRIGRTARAGRAGVAWTFVTPDQGELLTNVERLTNAEILQGDLGGFEPGPIPRAVLEARDAKQRADEQRREAVSRSTPAPPAPGDASDASKFPGGIVPRSVPGKRLGGRIRTRRGR